MDFLFISSIIEEENIKNKLYTNKLFKALEIEDN